MVLVGLLLVWCKRFTFGRAFARYNRKLDTYPGAQMHTQVLSSLSSFGEREPDR